ncbi:MAG: GerMN domain-containing protein [Candidatus Paceibacteria bacterium]
MTKDSILKLIIVVLITVAAAAGLYYLSAEKPQQDKRKNGTDKVATSSKKQVKLYYYNPKLDQDEQGNVLCSPKGLVGVDRKIDSTNTPIQDTIKLLLKGELTKEEKSQRIDTEYPLEGFKLVGANLENGQLTLEFEDPNNETSGGSCRANILWYQIRKTAKQFPQVDSVEYKPETLFQP